MNQNPRLQGYNSERWDHNPYDPFKQTKQHNEWVMGYIQKHGEEPEPEED